jgi:tRNA A-37 threonylcarbamoyl transferase component Bud32
VALVYSMVGELLGNYRIVAKLGSGSMGVVFLAEHQRLARRVAIKLLAPELIRDQHALQRFFIEARATSLIRHPGIVEIFDCDVDASGRAYMVMEHLQGETLADQLRRVGRLHWSAACLITRQAADALGAVHDKGIVHRDLKPENLFLVRDQRDPATTVVKLLDFGVAKLLAVDANARLTMRGMVVGTPEYMSPEQCGGSEIDHRADIYALGCILFEMLSGQTPFVSNSVEELMTAHRHFPVWFGPATTPGIPAWLGDLLARMLAKEPGQRPATMHEVSKEIHAHDPPGAPRMAARWMDERASEAGTLRAVPPPARARERWAAAVGPFGARRAAIAFALAAVFALSGAIWNARRRPAAAVHPTDAQIRPTLSTAAPPAAATSPLRPVPANDSVRFEAKPDRPARSARRAARPASPARQVDTDGIVDL